MSTHCTLPLHKHTLEQIHRFRQNTFKQSQTHTCFDSDSAFASFVFTCWATKVLKTLWWTQKSPIFNTSSSSQQSKSLHDLVKSFDWWHTHTPEWTVDKHWWNHHSNGRGSTVVSWWAGVGNTSSSKLTVTSWRTLPMSWCHNDQYKSTRVKPQQSLKTRASANQPPNITIDLQQSMRWLMSDDVWALSYNSWVTLAHCITSDLYTDWRTAGDTHDHCIPVWVNAHRLIE